MRREVIISLPLLTRFKVPTFLLKEYLYTYALPSCDFMENTLFSSFLRILILMRVRVGKYIWSPVASETYISSKIISKIITHVSGTHFKVATWIMNNSKGSKLLRMLNYEYSTCWLISVLNCLQRETQRSLLITFLG